MKLWCRCEFVAMKGCHLPRVQKSCKCIYCSGEAMRTYVGAHYHFINCYFSLFACIPIPIRPHIYFPIDVVWVRERTFLCAAYSTDESVLYTQRASERMYLCTDTLSRREISIRKRKKVGMRARSFHTQTHTDEHTFTLESTLTITDIITVVWKQIKHAYRSTMRLEWVTNNNSKWNQRRCDWIKSYHLLCTLYTTHCKVCIWLTTFFSFCHRRPMQLYEFMNNMNEVKLNHCLRRHLNLYCDKCIEIWNNNSFVFRFLFCFEGWQILFFSQQQRTKNWRLIISSTYLPSLEK